MSDRRFPLGATVRVKCPIEEHDGATYFTVHEPGTPATVVHHGRDQCGIYTRVRFEDGSEYDVHRSNLEAPR